MADMARHHPVDHYVFSNWKIFTLNLLPNSWIGWMVPVWLKRGLKNEIANN
jgi:hypothetical protein